MIGPADGILVEGAKRSAIEHGLKYEMLSSEEVRRRHPAVHPDSRWVAVSEPDAGILKPEICIQAHLRMAAINGATLRFEEPVLSWQIDGSDVVVTTSQGSYNSTHLIICAGAWAGPILKELSLPLKVSRQVLFWFQPLTESNIFSPERLPIYLVEFAKDRIFYGFPDLGDGVKVAIHREGEITEAVNVRRTVEFEEASELITLLKRYLPEAAGKLLRSEVCMYTNTPDGDFLLDFHPQYPQVLIASPCSGHGFKFSSAIGEAISDLIINGKSKYDLAPFSLSRLN
jgi:sarcosine oxidase